MWWAASSVESYLGTKRLGVRHPGRPAQWFDMPSEGAAVAQLESRLLGARPARGTRLRVWLSAALARPFIVGADSGVQSEAEVRAVAESIAADETGIAEPVAVWLDAWRRGRATAAAAMPAALMEQIRAACQRTKVRLSSVKPWWNMALDAATGQAKASDDVLWSLRESDGMTWGLLRAGVVARAECVLPSSADPDWIHARQRTKLAVGSGAVQWHARSTLNDGSPAALPIGAWAVDAADGWLSPSRRP